MDKFSKEDLEALVDKSGDHLLSVYMPTERSGSKVQQNRIRFKNLINEAQEAIGADKRNTEALSQQLAEISEWEADDSRWQHQSDGLAIFLDGEKLQEWKLPVEFPKICVCSNKYYVRPLCQLLQNDGRFYVLAVSLNKVRLFLGTKSSIAEVEEADIPEGLRSALNIDEYVSSLQQHTTTASGEGMFHGHGGSDPDVRKKDEIKQYFHLIEDALNDYFGVEKFPLVFAGVEYLFPIFRDACDYRNLVEKPVTGNPDDLSGEKLHEQAWPLVEKRFDVERAELLEQFGTALSNELGSDDLQVVMKAAQQGKVGTLLISQSEYVWNPRLDTNSTSQAEASAAEDLVNAALVETMRNGGKVYAVKEDQLDKPLAAIFRYR